MRGPASPSISSSAWCSPPPDRRRSTSTARPVTATTCSPTACSRSMRAPASAIWHFQGVKHDVWDWDFPAPPSLVTVRRNGRSIDAVAQVTKYGDVFVLDRRTGVSLFPIEYRKAPASTIDGEQAGRGAAVSDQAAAVRAPGPDRRHVDDAHARGARGGARAFPEDEVRVPDAAVVRRHDRVSRLRRRRGVGRRGVRSRVGPAVRQLERDAVDHQADPQQRHLALQLEVRDLPPRGSHGLAGRRRRSSTSASG